MVEPGAARAHRRRLAAVRQDVAAYVPEPETVKPAGKGARRAAGAAYRSHRNGDGQQPAAFREHALAVFGGIKTDLQTDADFADAERTVKWCKRLKTGSTLPSSTPCRRNHQHRRAVPHDRRDQGRGAAKRLTLDKLVKAEKENRKSEIVAQARKAYGDHWSALCRRVGGEWIPAVGVSYFGDAIKGLKSLDSMRDKVATALANAKIEANAIADRIDANRKTVEDMSLMPDFAQVCTKAPDDFAALYAMRKQQRAEAEAKRLEVEREDPPRGRSQGARRGRARRPAEREKIRKSRPRPRPHKRPRGSSFATAEARMQADAAKRAADLKAMAGALPEPACSSPSRRPIPAPRSRSARSISACRRSH